VDFRLGRRRRAFEEIEVATLVRLGDVLWIEQADFGAGRFHAARRRASSSLPTFSSSLRAGTSSSMRSPSRTRASGPPMNDSGATCSTQAP